jgi:hypothetical protein
MIVIIGVLVALVGLILVGTGGAGSVRRRRNFRLPIGVVLLAGGALFALLGGQIALTMGWVLP